MNEVLLVIYFILSFPFLSLLMKDGSQLFLDVKEALKDGRITKDEFEKILSDVGIVLRSIVRLVEFLIKKL